MTDIEITNQEAASALADKIRARRGELGMNQRDLAAAVGVKQQTISRWESATAAPAPGRVADLARVLGMDTAELLTAGGYVDSFPDGWAKVQGRLVRVEQDVAAPGHLKIVSSG